MISYYQNMYNSLQNIKAEVAQLSMSSNEASSLQASISNLQQILLAQIQDLMQDDQD